jgi:hypothetical protein
MHVRLYTPDVNKVRTFMFKKIRGRFNRFLTENTFFHFFLECFFTDVTTVHYNIRCGFPFTYKPQLSDQA